MSSIGVSSSTLNSNESTLYPRALNKSERLITSTLHLAPNKSPLERVPCADIVPSEFL